MNLLEQCQIWNENDEYQKIIDAIEGLGAGERTPELDSELARAYNNLAGLEDRALYEKAIALLKPHEAYFSGDHNWNFRIAYAYYYLDQEGPARHYFNQALEARPGDGDTQEYIDDCARRLSLPRFERPFRQRVEDGWAAFLEGEAELRRLLDLEDRAAAGETLIETCSALLAPAFADVSFELGYNGEKYELILTPEGSRSKLFALVYFQRHAPAAVLERWNILVGRQCSHGFGLRSFGQEISAGDVQAWVEREGEAAVVSLTLYCGKLLPLLEEQENRAWWMLSLLTDQVLGEIPAMALIEGFEVVAAPRAEPGILLEELPRTLEAMGLDVSPDPEGYLENCYTAYQMEPDKDPDADWRLDVFAGSNRCPALVNEYLRGESGTMDDFHRDGAAPGFFCYPLDGFPEGEGRGAAVLDFRDALEAAVLEAAGPDAVTFLGGASGVYCGYLDFIAWDLRPVLDAAAAYFKESPLEWANFHTFRRDVSTVRLLNREVGDAGASDGEDAGAGGGAGSFVGFVLLSEPRWDREELIRALEADWGLDAGGAEEDGDSLIFTLDGCMAAVSLMPAPVPGNEAEQNAANNYMWPQAVEAAEAHRAHLMVAVLGEEAGLLERGRRFVQVMACCSKQENATGLYTSGTVFEPRFYQESADRMKQGELPVYNWIWFGLYRGGDGVCGYTCGMDAFGKDELEVLDAHTEPSQVRDFLANLVCYVLEQDVTLRDGETIGFTAEQKLPITRSEGVSLPGMTLKIGYGAQD